MHELLGNAPDIYTSATELPLGAYGRRLDKVADCDLFPQLSCLLRTRQSARTAADHLRGTQCKFMRARAKGSGSLRAPAYHNAESPSPPGCRASTPHTASVALMRAVRDRRGKTSRRAASLAHWTNGDLSMRADFMEASEGNSASNHSSSGHH